MKEFNDVPSAGEVEAIEALVRATIEKQRKSYKPGTVARRDVHSKSLGVLDVKFHVHDRIPESCKVGLFAKPGSYDGLLRFSNGALGPNSFDIFPNIRGLALKLHGVEGAKLMPGEENSDEHDFLMANDRGFFMENIEQYLLLTSGRIGELARKHPRVILKLLGAMKIIKNPLFTDYFSQLPYQFGDYACKYALVAEEHAGFFSCPKIFDRDFLRHGVETVLRKHEARFRFCVQFQREGESIADSTRVWRGRFVQLGQLVVPRTTEAIPESKGEGLSFNPWRCLVQHQPLGWAGRTRRAVYAADFAWRTAQNAGK